MYSLKLDDIQEWSHSLRYIHVTLSLLPVVIVSIFLHFFYQLKIIIKEIKLGLAPYKPISGWVQAQRET